MVSGPKPGRQAFVGLHMLKDARAAGLNDQTDLFKWAAVPKRLQYPMFPDGRVDDETYKLAHDRVVRLAESIRDKVGALGTDGREKQPPRHFNTVQ